MSVRVLQGDCREVLKTLPDESVHCVVTSPPYWGLRDYGVGGQIGLESSPDEYVAELVAVFREVRRVMRKDATLWLNLGDSYGSRGGDPYSGFNARYHGTDNGGKQAATNGAFPSSIISTGLKPKDLVGIPWRVAFALQADGWWLRQDIIWSKPNPMPESVTDRCTKSHEYIFLMAKAERYYYDAAAIAEPASMDSGFAKQRMIGKANWSQATQNENGRGSFGEVTGNEGANKLWEDNGKRNKRSVWTVTTKPFTEAHFATFPPDLIEPCILAGTSEHGCCAKCGAPWEREVERTPMVIDRSIRTHELGRTRSSGTMIEPPTSTTKGWSPTCACDAPIVPCAVLDPFGGAGTTGLVADRLQRNAILIELNPQYAEMARSRIIGDSPLFAEVA